LRWCDAAIKKPGIAICEDCVHKFVELLNAPAEGEPTEPFKECFFCGFLRSPMPPFREIFNPKAKRTKKSVQELEDFYNDQFPGVKSFASESVGTRLLRGVDCAICDECVAISEGFLNH
jgi:hypothetical protein